MSDADNLRQTAGILDQIVHTFTVLHAERTLVERPSGVDGMSGVKMDSRQIKRLDEIRQHLDDAAGDLRILADEVER